jgi:chaperone BCS1
LSIAGELEMDIYIVSIPVLTDQMLKTLFSELAERCVVLLGSLHGMFSNDPSIHGRSYMGCYLAPGYS